MNNRSFVKMDSSYIELVGIINIIITIIGALNTVDNEIKISNILYLLLLIVTINLLLSIMIISILRKSNIKLIYLLIIILESILYNTIIITNFTKIDIIMFIISLSIALFSIIINLIIVLYELINIEKNKPPKYNDIFPKCSRPINIK